MQSETKSESKVLLLLSGGKDSPEALRRLQRDGHLVHGLCIDGVQGKEKIGAQKTADRYGVELSIESIPWFDEETWNPFLLVKRDIAMAAAAIRKARAVGASAIATGVKRVDIENPALWWLGPFLWICQLLAPLIGLKLLFPVWNWGHTPKSRFKKVRKFSRKVVRKVTTFTLSKLPSSVRHALYRRLYLAIPKPEEFAGFNFEIARTREDLEAAYRLLHDVYAEQKFIAPNSSGLRLVLQHALPTTTTIVAKHGDKVVGTVSLMRDNPLGLPMEKVFELENFRTSGSRLVEFSCLAIHPDYRRDSGGALFIPMLVFAYLYCQNYFGADYIVLNVFPHHADFYCGLFGGVALSDGDTRQPIVKDYLGAPATPVVISLGNMYEYAQTTYRNTSDKHNLFKFAYHVAHENFKFPKRSPGQINDSVMTPELLEYFFRQKVDILSSLARREWQVLKRYYADASYKSLMPHLLGAFTDERTNGRYDSSLRANLMSGDEVVNIQILDVSEAGFRAYLENEVQFGAEAQIEFQIESHPGFYKSVEVSAQPMWKNEKQIYGFRIHRPTSSWLKFLEGFDIKRQAPAKPVSNELRSTKRSK